MRSLQESTTTTTGIEQQSAPSAYRPDQLPALLTLSQAMCYRMIRDGRIRSIRAGRRYIVPADAVADFLANGPRTEAQIKANA